jgi:dTDP-4-amino-4,6-dideoxygalactose transaminase
MLVAAGIGPGDEVLVPSFTWISSANVVLMCGAIPRLVDIDIETFNLNISDMQSKVNSRIKAVIAVHLFGKPLDIRLIRSKLPEGILIFEDAACAAGSRISGEKVGSLGDAAAFSFHPRKVLTTGEGGMVTTDSFNLASKIKILRSHGIEPLDKEVIGRFNPAMPDIKSLGYNYRLTDIQAAIGIVQLSKLDKFISERNGIAEAYSEAFAKLSWFKTPTVSTNETHAFQAYVGFIHDSSNNKLRDKLAIYLYERGISTRPGTHAVHMLTQYKSKFNYQDKNLPNSMSAHNSSIALPIFNGICEGQIHKVIDAITGFIP